MRSKKTLFIANTGILLALTLVIQLFGGAIFGFLGPAKLFVTGSLINACLLLATVVAGKLSGAVISFVAPITAGFLNHTALAAFILPFSPIIGIGNFIYVLIFSLILEKNKYIAIGLGSILKFVFLLVGSKIALGLIDLKEPLAVMAAYSFSWPQLVTAVIGGIIAILSVGAIRKGKSTV